MLDDKTRMALELLITNIVAFLVLSQIVNWSGDQVAGFNSIITSGLILAMYKWPSSAAKSVTVEIPKDSESVTLVTNPENEEKDKR